MQRRVIGPLSPRVNYLEAAIRVAESLLRMPDPSPAAVRLLRRFAANIPGASQGARPAPPELVATAAHAELKIHQDQDLAARQEAAARVRAQLGDAEQLFGSRMRVIPHSGTGA